MVTQVYKSPFDDSTPRARPHRTRNPTDGRASTRPRPIAAEGRRMRYQTHPRVPSSRQGMIDDLAHRYPHTGGSPHRGRPTPLPWIPAHRNRGWAAAAAPMSALHRSRSVRPYPPPTSPSRGARVSLAPDRRRVGSDAAEQRLGFPHRKAVELVARESVQPTNRPSSHPGIWRTLTPGGIPVAGPPVSTTSGRGHPRDT